MNQGEKIARLVTLSLIAPLRTMLIAACSSQDFACRAGATTRPPAYPPSWQCLAAALTGAAEQLRLFCAVARRLVLLPGPPAKRRRVSAICTRPLHP
jgi:hypothetical protein